MQRKWFEYKTYEKLLAKNGVLETSAGVLLLLFGLLHPAFAFALGAGFLIVLGVFRMQESGVIPTFEKWITKSEKHE
jgi:hypothetical protein